MNNATKATDTMTVEATPSAPGVKRIPLMRFREVVGHALVDEADYESLSRHRWGMLRSGATFYAYRQKHVAGTRQTHVFYMHREVLGLPRGTGHAIEADHINHQGLDNRRENLRAVTRSANLRNRRPLVRVKGANP